MFSTKIKYHQLEIRRICLLTLFRCTGLLSSTGSTAAALTLSRTPMRAATTTRSCMLWRECRWRSRATLTGGSRRACVRARMRVCEMERVWAAWTGPEQSGGGGGGAEWLGGAGQDLDSSDVSSALTLKPLTRLYASSPLTWRAVGVCVCVFGRGYMNVKQDLGGWGWGWGGLRVLNKWDC